MHPLAAVVTFHFPARGRLPPVKLTWYEGLEAPRARRAGRRRQPAAGGGAIFKGTKGTIISGVYGTNPPQLVPAKRMKETTFPQAACRAFRARMKWTG